MAAKAQPPREQRLENSDEQGAAPRGRGPGASGGVIAGDEAASCAASGM